MKGNVGGLPRPYATHSLGWNRSPTLQYSLTPDPSAPRLQITVNYSFSFPLNTSTFVFECCSPNT